MIPCGVRWKHSAQERKDRTEHVEIMWRSIESDTHVKLREFGSLGRMSEVVRVCSAATTYQNMSQLTCHVESFLLRSAVADDCWVETDRTKDQYPASVCMRKSNRWKAGDSSRFATRLEILHQRLKGVI